MKTLHRLKAWLHRVTAPTDRVTQRELDVWARDLVLSKTGVDQEDIVDWLQRQDEWETGRKWSETEEEADQNDHWISLDDWLFHTAEAAGYLTALCPAADVALHNRRGEEDVEDREYKIAHMED